MDLKRRIRTLERAAAPAGRCEACGYGSGSPPKFVVHFADEPFEGPEFCPECGRALIFKLTFDNPREPDAP